LYLLPDKEAAHIEDSNERATLEAKVVTEKKLKAAASKKTTSKTKERKDRRSGLSNMSNLFGTWLRS
jgi:hypothetical protein